MELTLPQIAKIIQTSQFIYEKCKKKSRETRKAGVKNDFIELCKHIIGVVERGSQKVLLFRVPDRTRETLAHRLITTHIQPGTVIYSDQFTLYIPLNQLGYIHVSVNHSKNFVDPDSGAHTNTIEGIWALVKKKLKWMCGTLYEYIPSYLDEFTWFRNFGKDQAFEQLLKDIAEQFPLQ